MVGKMCGRSTRVYVVADRGNRVGLGIQEYTTDSVKVYTVFNRESLIPAAP